MALSRLAAMGVTGRVLRQEQVGVGPVLVPPDPAAKLVQLGQAEAVGVVDEDRVGVGDVEARLDDRRADQHVGRAEHELDHRVFQLVLAHLAVADGDPGVRANLLDLAGHLLDGLDAVVQEEDLALAVQLAEDRLADQLLVVGRDAGDDAAAVQRRGGQRADVAQAQQRHVQRARDGRGGHRQHVHVDAACCLSRSLCSTPNRCSSSMISRPRSLNATSLAEEPVRADQDVDLALAGPLDDVLGLPAGLEAVEDLDREREVGEPLA